MSFDVLSAPAAPDTVRIIGGNLSFSNGPTNQQTGSIYGGVQNPGAASLAMSVTSNGTITPVYGRVVRVQAGGTAVTSAAIATGAFDGQDLTLINTTATAITISTNVAPITTLSATAGAAAGFSWDAGQTLWCHRT